MPGICRLISPTAMDIISHPNPHNHDVIVKGLWPVMEGFVVAMQEGACEQEVKYWGCLAEGFDALFTQTWVHRDNKPQQISLNRDYIMTFQFHLMNVSILHLKYQYGARSESRFACYSHCYVMWCPLTMKFVDLQCPSSRDAALMTCYLTPLILACLNLLKRILYWM